MGQVDRTFEFVLYFVGCDIVTVPPNHNQTLKISSLKGAVLCIFDRRFH